MPKTITKLSSYAQACELTGQDPKATVTPEIKASIIFNAACTLLNIAIMPTMIYEPELLDYCVPLKAHYKLQIIRNAVTGNWIPDWKDYNVRKWSNWFRFDEPGFRFYGALYDDTYSVVGSWLCFETKEQSEFVGRDCIALYRDLLGGGALAKAA